MYIVLAELDNDLIIQDDEDGAVDVVPKVSIKLLLNYGVSISGANLDGSNLVVKPTMQYFAESFLNPESEDGFEDDEEDDGFYYDDFDDDNTSEETEDEEDESEFEEDDYYYDDTEEEEAEFDEEEDFVYYDDIEDEDESTVAKLYSFLNDEQIKALKRYYLWFSQRIFTDAQKDPTLGMKSKAALQRKKEDLNQLRNTGGLWHYAGFVDMGCKGAGYCTLGHPLRYLHLAWDVSVSDIESAFFGEDYNDDFEEAIYSNNCIVFGIKCISDFFEVNKECMSALQKAQRDSLKDMALMYKYYESGRVDEINSTFSIMDEIVTKTKTRDTKGVLFNKDYKPIIPLNLCSFYLQFRELGLIPPKSLVQEIRDSLIGWTSHKLIYERADTTAMILHMPKPSKLIELLPILLTKSKSQGLIKALESTNTTYYFDRSFECYVYNFISVYFMYKICGHYEYNGDTQADEGGKNKKILEAHSSALKLAKKYSGVDFSLATLEKLNTFMDCILSYTKIKSLLEVPTAKYVSETGLYDLNNDDKGYESSYVREYSTEFADAVDFYSELHTLSSYDRKSLHLFNSSNIDECISIISKHKSCLDENIEKFIQFATNKVIELVDELNEKNLARKREAEERIKAEAERKRIMEEESNALVEKAKSVKTDKEVVQLISEYGLDKITDSKFEFAKKLVKQLSTSGYEPTRNQMYYISKLFSHITGVEYKSSDTNDKVLLKDRPELNEALNYIVDNNIQCADDRTFDIIKSIVKYGSISERQMKYAESGLQTYNDLRKE